MQRRSILGFTLALLIVCSVSMAAAQESREADNPLLRLLDFVPNTSAYRMNLITYGDVAAWAEGWGFDRVGSLMEADALTDERVRGYWLFLMPYQAIPAEPLGFQHFRADDQIGYYGFDFASLDRVLAAGAPPSIITAAEYSFDSARIRDALTASGYEAQPLENAQGTLYSILEDYQPDISGETVRTRTGQLGALNRIALLEGGQMIIGRATEVVDTALAAMNGEVRSLADDPYYNALAAALFAPELEQAGQLAGVALADGTLFGMDAGAFLMDPRITREQAAQLLQQYQDEYLNRYPLPPFVAAAFATYHREGATTLVLALALLPGTDQQAAAAALQGRFEHYTSLRTRQPMLEILEERSSQVEGAIGFEAEQIPIIALLIRSEDPPETFIPGKISAEPVEGSLPFAWLQMIFARDTGFLVPATGEDLAPDEGE